MLTEPIRLSHCGSRLVLDAEEDYTIAIEEGTHLVVGVGAFAGSPACHFTDPNIACSHKKICEFKHDHPTRGKFWTQRAAMMHYFVIPRYHVFLLPQKGYSWIPAEINGVRVTFNVSGGSSGSRGWTDRLGTEVWIGIGHPVKHLKQFAAVAVRGTPYEAGMQFEPLTPEEDTRWTALAASASESLKAEIYRRIEAKQRPMIHLKSRYSYSGEKAGPATQIHYRTFGPKRVVGVLLDLFGRPVYVKLSQIDWRRTAEINGLHLQASGALVPASPSVPTQNAVLSAAETVDIVQGVETTRRAQDLEPTLVS